MIKVTYEVVMIVTQTNRISDQFSPVFADLDQAKDWMNNQSPLVAGYEYRICKTTVELV